MRYQHGINARTTLARTLSHPKSVSFPFIGPRMQGIALSVSFENCHSSDKLYRMYYYDGKGTYIQGSCYHF